MIKAEGFPHPYPSCSYFYPKTRSTSEDQETITNLRHEIVAANQKIDRQPCREPKTENPTTIANEAGELEDKLTKLEDITLNNIEFAENHLKWKN